MFIYQPNFRKLHLKAKKSTCHIFSWKLKDIHNSKLNTLHVALATNVKYFACSIEIQFSKIPFVVQKSNYSTKIINLYIADYWSFNPLINFKLRNYFSGATKIVENSDKFEHMYHGYRTSMEMEFWELFCSERCNFWCWY